MLYSLASPTPGVSFNPDSRVFEFEGVSRPENVSEFYKPVIEWMTDFNLISPLRG